MESSRTRSRFCAEVIRANNTPERSLSKRGSGGRFFPASSGVEVNAVLSLNMSPTPQGRSAAGQPSCVYSLRDKERSAGVVISLGGGGSASLALGILMSVGGVMRVGAGSFLFGGG